MRSLRKKLLFPVVAVVCLSIAFLMAVPAHAASVHPASVTTASHQAHPFTLGGGYYWSMDARVEACISVDSGGHVLSDAYIQPSPCATYVYIELDDLSTGGSAWTSYNGGCGHFSGPFFSESPGTYKTWVEACFSDIGCEWRDSPPQQI